MSSQRVPRFSQKFVLVHGLIVLSFTICILTGLPLKFEWWGLTRALGGHETAKWIHRISGAVMVIVAVLYALSAFLHEIRSGFQGGLWPKAKDFGEFFGELKFLFGAVPERPKFGKFTYQNKMEFWLGSIGIFLMSVSGIVLWFPRLGNAVVIESSHVIHSWEAVLALVAIYIWHVYHVHTLHGKPRLNTVWLTGEISVEELKHEFPAEYEKLQAQGELPKP